MKTSLVFEQDSPPRPLPGRPAREAGGNPRERTRVVVQVSEAQRAQLFSFATEQNMTASDVVRRALVAMGVITE